MTTSMLEEPTLNDELLKTRSRIFSEFLSFSNPPHYSYPDNVQLMLRRDETRLIVNVDDLRSYNREFATGILKHPNDYFPAFNDALSSYVELVRDPEKHDISGKDYRIGFSGSFGDQHLNP